MPLLPLSGLRHVPVVPEGVVSSVFCIATAAAAQWRSLQSPDEESGETVTLAHASGLDGRLSLLVTCRQGYYVLALGFDFDDDAKFGGATVEMRWDGRPAERHCLYPDYDDEVLYLTTWPGEESMLRYDPEALAVFGKFRSHRTWGIKVTRHPDREVTERFDLGGAAQALDSLQCGTDRRPPE